MVYHIDINDIEPHHWVAWVYELHGCFSKATTHDTAIAQVPDTIKNYFAWLKGRNPIYNPPESPIEIDISEDIRSVLLDDGYFANAFFEHDRIPLTNNDINDIRRLLEYTRKDLFTIINKIPPMNMDKPIAGEVQKSIRGILNHIATAEWWYFDRFDISFDRKEMPEDTILILKKVREHTLSLLPSFIHANKIVKKREERWSVRKIMRRTLWHEITHARQIQRYLNEMN